MATHGFWTAVACVIGGIHIAVVDWAFSRWFTPDQITWHEAIRDGLRFAIFAYVVLLVGAALLQAGRGGRQPGGGA